MSGVGETARSLPRPAFRREVSNVHLRPPDQADAGWSGESARGAEYLDKITKIVEAEGGHLERVSLRVGARRRSRRPGAREGTCPGTVPGHVPRRRWSSSKMR